ncbi:PPE-repeat protein [Saccharothrix saharensis]|uniref:PPE-repeat protein n=1 Tax=Saccharothrix saharensis TaxID=571190 RepID=A0A543JIS6_9PSEU|nr:PPE domain-containing protein [Saccharothrix saharensis]TQM82733.1 PPE-repeat protein [Saccharothrix saharensis]
MPDGHRWSGYSHEELYEQINAGPGPKASHASMERWQGVSAALTEINADLHAGVLRSGATWEGAAADKARMGINPLAAWADDARAGAEVMRRSAERQADHIAKARSDMPPPVKVTAEEPNLLVTALTNLVGGQTDYEVQEQAKNAAEQRAREVMTTYASSTFSNTSTLAQFHQPPQLVIGGPDAVRNDSAGVSAPGWGYGGPRGGRGGGRGGWRGGRGGRGGYQGPRPVAQPSYGGGSTGTSWTGTSGTTRASTAALPASASGSAPVVYGPGGVIGGQQGKDRKSTDTTNEQQHAGGSGPGAGGGGGAGSHAGTGAGAGANQLLPGANGSLPVPSGTTTTSSAEFGAFATANAQHAATTAPGSPGAMPGAGGQVGGNDTVHKRSTPAPAQPVFDPFGGLGGPRGAEEEEDATHDAADYLRQTDDIYGLGGIISPPVIGESTTR